MMQQGGCISTSQALRQEMNYWRETCALPADQLELYDGSGLAPRSKLSPYALTAALRQVYQDVYKRQGLGRAQARKQKKNSKRR